MKKPTIGQEMFAKKVDDRAGTPDKIVKVKVVKIGREYFKVTSLDEWEGRFEYSRFRLSNWREAGSFSSWAIYESEQAIQEEAEAVVLKRSIAKQFEWMSRKSFTLDQLKLKRIEAIVNED